MKTIQMYGADWCPDCQRAKAFLKENEILFTHIDVDKDPSATAIVEKINNGKRIIPTLIIDGQAYTNPDNGLLREVLEIEAEEDQTMYDSIIIGAGAAGLSTAIYAQRDGYSTLMLEKKNIGGNAYLTDKIENYPGFEEISGPALMKRMSDQAIKLGTIIKQGTDVRGIFKQGNDFRVETNVGEFYAKSIVIATGSSYRKLGIPGEADLIGSGVHFCATCDGAFYKNQEVVVVGGGNSAVEEGMHLAGLAKKVTFINRGEQFAATHTYLQQLQSFDNITVWHHSEILAFEQDQEGKFTGARIRNKQTQEENFISANGAFVFVGLVPNTGFVKKTIALDEQKFILTDEAQTTSVPGIFAAGDGRKGAIAQVAFAVGEGVAASYSLRKYLKAKALETSESNLVLA